MHEDGFTPDKPYRKCATTVCDVLGRYHPHGDSSVYDAYWSVIPVVVGIFSLVLTGVFDVVPGVLSLVDEPGTSVVFPGVTPFVVVLLETNVQDVKETVINPNKIVDNSFLFIFLTSFSTWC